MHRLLVSAAHKSSGKTTVTLGLCAALASQGTRVQPFKKGPDYIDPMWLARAAGRPCLNLDGYLMDDAALVRCFVDAMADADIGIVEGNKGLYDGLALDGSNSNAALARRLGLPVLLVIDARGMTRGIAPLILGYQAFDREIRIGGVILNRLGGARHEAKLRAVIEHYTDVPVLGAVAEDERLAVAERHLGLMPCAELDDAQQRVQAIGRIVGEQVDLGRVRALAASAGPLVPPQLSFAGFEPASQPALRSAGCRSPDLRIGIARDRAFGFYYPDDLAALQAAGAELVPFDTLHDRRLPAIDGLFIGITSCPSMTTTWLWPS
jgi:cobyrinic acid a,c-diamide synthase